MVLDKEFQLDLEEHAAMLQNKAMIQNNVILKRKKQLEHWENSEMNQICPKRNNSHQSKVKFQNRDIFLSACQSGDEDEVEELLKKGSDINSSTIDGVTALHQAVIDGNMDIVKFLVQHNADINAQDNEGWTPLHAAVCCGNLNIAKYLYEHNADLSCVNSDRELPVDLADNDEMRNYLEEVMRLKDIDERSARESEFNTMMEDCERWINSGKCLDSPHPKTGATALHVASAKGYIKLIEMLINAGADINYPDFEGWTPLHAAAHWGERESCRILIENGANINALTYVGHSIFSVADKSLEEYLYTLKEEQDKNCNVVESKESTNSNSSSTNDDKISNNENQIVKEGSVESTISNSSSNEENKGNNNKIDVENRQVEEDEEVVEGVTEQPEHEPETISTSETTTNQGSSSTNQTSLNQKQKVISHSNSPVSEDFSSNTGSGISSIQTTSRSVTPKDRSSSLYSSDQSVQCTIRSTTIQPQPKSKDVVNNLEKDRSTSSSPITISTSSNSTNIKSTSQTQHSKSPVIRAAEETVKRLRRQLPCVQSTITKIPLTPLPPPPQERAKSSSVDCGKPPFKSLLNVESSTSSSNIPLKSPPSSAPLVQSARLFWNSIENNGSTTPQVQQSQSNVQQQSQHSIQNHPIGSTQLYQQQFQRSRQKFALAGNQISIESNSGGNSTNSSNNNSSGGSVSSLISQSPFAYVAGEQHKQQQSKLTSSSSSKPLFKRAESLKIVGSNFNNNSNGIFNNPSSNIIQLNQQNSQNLQQQPQQQQFMLWRQQTVTSKDLLKDPKERKNSYNKTTKVFLAPPTKNLVENKQLPLTAAFTASISNAATTNDGTTTNNTPSESCSSSIAASPSSISPLVNFPFVTVRKQSLQQTTPPTQPTSQKESESERKAKSKLKRSTRRSTQGVTLEQLGEAAAAGRHNNNNGSHNNNGINYNYHHQHQSSTGDRVQQANEKFNCYMEVSKENREVFEELKYLKKTVQDLQVQQQHLKNEINLRDRLIHENGFLIVKPNNDLINDDKKTCIKFNLEENGIDFNKSKFEPLLLSYSTLSAIEKALPGTSGIDSKILKIVETNRKFRQQIDEAEKVALLYNNNNNNRRQQQPQSLPSHYQQEDYNFNCGGSSNSSSNNNDDSLHRDALKQLTEMKLKLQEIEREKLALEGAYGRSETQLKRFKSIAEQSEKESEELQKLNRQLKKELRDKEQIIEENKETINHLQSRLDKMRQTKRPI